jgi:hypothetical protein
MKFKEWPPGVGMMRKVDRGMLLKRNGQAAEERRVGYFRMFESDQAAREWLSRNWSQEDL